MKNLLIAIVALCCLKLNAQTVQFTLASVATASPTNCIMMVARCFTNDPIEVGQTWKVALPGLTVKDRTKDDDSDTVFASPGDVNVTVAKIENDLVYWDSTSSSDKVHHRSPTADFLKLATFVADAPKPANPDDDIINAAKVKYPNGDHFLVHHQSSDWLTFDEGGLCHVCEITKSTSITFNQLF